MNYEYPPIGGGGATAAHSLAQTLVRLGDEVDVVTSGMNGVAAYEELEGVNVHRARCKRRHKHYTTLVEMLTGVVPAYRKSLELDRRVEYSINHTHFIVPSGLASYLLWRKTRLPYVITIHGSDVPGYNPDRFKIAHELLQPLWKKIVRNASCLITPSRFVAELMQKRIATPVELIPYGVDFPLLPQRKKANRILVVTRMFERKGVQYFLRALRGLDTDWEVYVAGDGPYLPKLRKIAADVRMPVKFVGFVRNQQLWDLYQSAKIFVFPSVQENFPNVLLEAMHADCAVITTSAAGCVEVVQDAAIKVRPGSVDELRAALQKLIGDGREIDRLTARGRCRVAELSCDRIAVKYQEIFARYARGG